MICRNIQRTRSPFDERQTTVAAHWESTTDRNVQVAQVGYQHLFDTAELQVVLDGVERAEDDALDAFEIQLQAQCIEP